MVHWIISWNYCVGNKVLFWGSSVVCRLGWSDLGNKRARSRHGKYTGAQFLEERRALISLHTFLFLVVGKVKWTLNPENRALAKLCRALRARHIHHQQPVDILVRKFSNDSKLICAERMQNSRFKVGGWFPFPLLVISLPRAVLLFMLFADVLDTARGG